MKFSIIHFSDIHVPAEVSFSGLFDKRLLGCCNSLLIRQGRYNLELFRRAIPQFLEKKPSMFVFTGDAVSTADPREFEKALKEFQPLIDSRIPILYVPEITIFTSATRRAVRQWKTFMPPSMDALIPMRRIFTMPDRCALRRSIVLNPYPGTFPAV